MTVAAATSLVAPVVIMQPQAAPPFFIDCLSQHLGLARAFGSAPHSAGPTATTGPAGPMERQ